MTESANLKSGILEVRRIEARILKDVFDVLCEQYGNADARRVLELAISNAAIAHGKELAGMVEGEPDLVDFMNILPMWTRDGALEIDILEADTDHVDFNVTKCRYAEMYSSMGLREIGDLLSCNRDGRFCAGYNPKIDFTRTQTIMKGASHCDFRLRLEIDNE